MKKSIKRFLPFVIVLALCMSLFTVSAFAVDKRQPHVEQDADGNNIAVDKDGNVIRTGWVAVNPEDSPKQQTWYYASKGKLVTGWQKIDGEWYYFNEDSSAMKANSAKTGPAYIYDGDDDTDNAQKWQDAKNFWWFNADGSLYSGPSGWVSTMGTTRDGTPHRYWFYVNSDGSIYKGWVEDGAALYEVDPALVEGPTVDTYPGEQFDENYYGVSWEDVPHFFIDKTGAVTKNDWASILWTSPDGSESGRAWFYADKNGVLAEGWTQIDGKWYFFGSPDPDDAGKYNDMRQNDWFMIDGVRYHVDKSGARTEGWGSTPVTYYDDEGNVVSTGRTWQYYQPGTGAQVEDGWKKIDGKWYLFSNYDMVANAWVEGDSDDWYYLGTDGAMVTGWVQDDVGEWYNFGTDGALKTDTWIEDNGSWYYVDSNGEMARNEEIDGWYVGSDGAWIPD